MTKSEILDRIVPKLQSYLTQKEAKEIIPQFKENFDPTFDPILTSETASEIICGGFDWADSPEGDDYWNDIYHLIYGREEQERARC